MGQVYHAYDEEIKTEVALKVLDVLRAGGRDALEMLKEELRNAREVTHPNVCRVFDIGHDGDIHFITMQYVQGQTLEDLLKEKRRLSWDELRPIATAACEGLAAAHSRGVVHRDVKPSNILLARDGSVFLADFSLARIEKVDTTSAVGGTPGYMAPEQFLGQGVLPTADIYSLGVVLYRALTGSLPYRAGMSGEDKSFAIGAVPVPITEKLPDLDRDLSSTVMKCLSLNPAARYPDATSLLPVLKGEAPAPWTSLRRHRVRLAAVLTVLLAVAAGLFWISQKTTSRRGFDSSRPRAAVVYFESQAGEANQWLETGLAEMLTTELGHSPGVLVVGGERVAEMLRNLGLSPRRHYDQQTVRSIGEFLGVDYLITGAIYGIEGRLRAEFRAVRTSGNEVLGMGKSEAIGEAAYLDLASDLGRQLRAQLDPGATAGASTLDGIASAVPEANVFYAEGVRALREGKYVEARPLLEKAVEKDPAFARAHLALSEAWRSTGYERKAADAAKRAFDLSPTLRPKERLRIEARYQAALHENERAWQLYRDLVASEPDDLDLALEAANFLVEAPKFAEAERVARQVLERSPAHAEAFLLLGKALAGRSQYDEALAALGRARGLYRTAKNVEGEGKTLIQVAAIHSSRGSLDEALKTFEEAKSKSRAIGDRLGEAAALSGIANVHLSQGRYEEALVAHRETLEVARTMGNQRAEARAQLNLGTVLFRKGDLSVALEAFQESMALMEGLGDRQGVSDALNGIGNVFRLRGDLAEAERTFRQVIALAEEVGNRRRQAAGLSNLGATLRARGDLAGAEKAYDEGLAIAQEIGDREVAAFCLLNSGYVRYSRGDDGPALERFEAARAAFSEIRVPMGVWASFNGIGNVHFAQEQFEKALSVYEQARDLLKVLDSGQALVCIGNIGEALYELRRDQEAERNLKEALALATKMADKVRAAEFSAYLAAIRARRGEREEGIRQLRSAVADLDEMGEVDPRVRLRALLGRILTEAGDFKAAKQVFEEGLGLARATGLKRQVEKIEKALARKEFEKP
jgi:tetratricopeptide (TPR) repeat protein